MRRCLYCFKSGIVLLFFTCTARNVTLPPDLFFPPGKTTALFNGTDLGYWKPSDFVKNGEILVQDGSIVIGEGSYLSGITWTGPLVTGDYEISLDAKRIEGDDFFCGLTVPFRDMRFSLILGGWGGSLTGLSCINGYDASENETTDWMRFENGRWYHVRLAVSDTIRAWVDDRKIVEVDAEGKHMDIRIEVTGSLPMGIATYMTKAAVRNIVLKR